MYVSNEKDNVYSIQGLPEEVIAVIFAYISRSPKSFRENLHKVTEEKAKDFHEKWVLNYGHSSVAEHAVIHLGIEKVSRLFSGELERSNRYLSFTEYSQRYQKPKRGDYYTPEGIDTKHYTRAHDMLFTIYENIVELLCDNGYSEKEAFEDARYVLPLSTYTSLGMTGNARALRDSINILLSSVYKESNEIGEKMLKEASVVAPTLIKYAKRDPDTAQRLYHERYLNQVAACVYTGSYIAGLRASEHNKHMPEYYRGTKFSKHEYIPDWFEHIEYNMYLYMSEACYHQFLRHRGLKLLVSPPTVTQGYYTPDSIKRDEKCLKLYKEAVDLSERLFYNLESYRNVTALEPVRDYLVLNAYLRGMYVRMSLKDVINLKRIRTTESTQKEFRMLAQEIVKQVEALNGKSI